jgi:folate-binding protein YgfZ
VNDHWPYDAVRVSGPDAQSYLQSQLSQDIKDLGVGERTWTFLLQPNGRVDVLAELVRIGTDSYDMRVDAGWGQALIARLNRFKIRVKATVEAVDGQAGDPAAYHVDRVEAGWPAMGAEITEATIPGELPDVVRVAVSFTKGCYPGQELVERMDSRAAQAPRHLVRLDVEAGAQPGDPIVVDGATVGALTSVAGARALGFVKRGVELQR